MARSFLRYGSKRKTDTKKGIMRQIISILAISGLAFTMASCENRRDRMVTEEKQRIIDSMHLEMVRQQTIDSMNEVVRMEQEMMDEDGGTAGTTRQSASGSSGSTYSGTSSGTSS